MTWKRSSLGQVQGLQEALLRDPKVCSNYHPTYVLKTFPALEAIQSGNAIFTVPNTPIKCAGAPQKIMYLGEEIFRKVSYFSFYYSSSSLSSLSSFFCLIFSFSPFIFPLLVFSFIPAVRSCGNRN